MRRVLVLVLAAAMAFGIALVPATPALATEPLNGGGSTWSAVAIQQWQADLQRQGVTVNYQATGSTAGRQGYYNAQYDFAVSEIPFQAKYCTNPADPNTCSDEQSLVKRPYTYMPIVAGGTSILYNLQINGQAFTKLQLSPHTLTEIFTGKINNWNAPDIAADNPGVAFPSQNITPVVRSDGSGTSYQFTAFMSTEDPTDWNAFCASQGIPTPCPPTSQYPAPTSFAAQSGSDGVANFVAAPYNNGAIGYAESAYGLERGVPLASLKNAAGQYVQPTARNVAEALTLAVINPDHTQNLLGVYANIDPRTYPMSSYSYMIVPTGPTTSPMDASKNVTLGQFILYFLCQGQQEAAPLGYSPLPPNLVQLGFSVEQQIPGAPAPPALQNCNNPTITGNFLAGIAPPAPGGGGGGGAGGGSRDGGGGSKGGGGGGGGGGTTTPGAGPGGSTGTGSRSGASGSPTAGGTSTTVAKAAGGPVGPLNPGSTDTTAASGPDGTVLGGPVQVAFGTTSQKFGRSWQPLGSGAAFLVAVLVLGVALGPPVLSIVRRRRT